MTKKKTNKKTKTKTYERATVINCLKQRGEVETCSKVEIDLTFINLHLWGLRPAELQCLSISPRKKEQAQETSEDAETLRRTFSTSPQPKLGPRHNAHRFLHLCSYQLQYWLLLDRRESL